MNVVADDLLTVGTTVFLYTSLHVNSIFVRLEISLPLFVTKCRLELMWVVASNSCTCSTEITFV